MDTLATNHLDKDTWSQVTKKPIDEQLFDYLSIGPTIHIGTIHVADKEMSVQLKRSPRVTEGNNYFIEIGDKPVILNEIIGGKPTPSFAAIVGRKEDIDIDRDKNVIYIWDQNNLWKKYEVLQDGKNVDLLLKGKTRYNPLKVVKKELENKQYKFSIIEYKNPLTSKWKENQGKILFCKDYFSEGNNLEVDFPNKEWVTLDEKTIRINNKYEMWIYDTENKLHKYEIHMWADKLDPMN